jgi:hypothetical protein
MIWFYILMYLFIGSIFSIIAKALHLFTDQEIPYFSLFWFLTIPLIFGFFIFRILFDLVPDLIVEKVKDAKTKLVVNNRQQQTFLSNKESSNYRVAPKKVMYRVVEYKKENEEQQINFDFLGTKRNGGIC